MTQKNSHTRASTFEEEVENFSDFGTKSRKLKLSEISDKQGLPADLTVYVNEFWTAQQRACHSLHEISYRACFKPQLPRFFIERLTKAGDIVYDPFMGRGTTAMESALLGRVAYGNDINPLSTILIEPRLNPPTLRELELRLEEIELEQDTEIWDELLTFYHPHTLRALSNLRRYLLSRQEETKLDGIDKWIRMVATNRLSGHSAGFFSVYTLPPNQATSLESQRKINAKRQQTPPERDVKAIILTKSASLLADLSSAERQQLETLHPLARFSSSSAEITPAIKSSSVELVVTSPPFLSVVDYARDNWLRAWFNGIQVQDVPIWKLNSEKKWQAAMTEVLKELKRLLTPSGHIAFEVGEVKAGKLNLETLVIPAALEAGLKPRLLLINQQEFTKTAQCWGVSNSLNGTNTNRIVLMQKN